MKLCKVISGGQTGADQQGLECAKLMGLETGGTAPKGYKTENGPNLLLKSLFFLNESPSSDYKIRTRDNVRDSDCTLWFGKTNTPGYYCTENFARTSNKPFYRNPDALQMRYVATTYGVVNVAGNRKSKNPEVCELVKRAFGHVLLLLEQEKMEAERDKTGTVAASAVE